MKKTTLFRSCLFLIILFYVLSLLGTVISDNSTCPTCGGAGTVCAKCGGAGEHGYGQVTCPTCGGRGYLLPPDTPILSTSKEPATLPPEPIENTMSFSEKYPNLSKAGYTFLTGIVLAFGVFLGISFFAGTAYTTVSTAATSIVMGGISYVSSIPYIGTPILKVLTHPFYLKFLSNQSPVPTITAIKESLMSKGAPYAGGSSQNEGNSQIGHFESDNLSKIDAQEGSTLQHELKHSTKVFDQVYDQTREMAKEYANQNNWTNDNRTEMDKYIKKHANDPNELKKLQQAAKGGGLEHFLRK